MTKGISFFVIVLSALLYAGGAEAQASRTWVSGAGSDSNSCTRAAPCATFQHAFNATAAGGEIDVLDGGDYGPVNITHSITIADDGAGTGGFTPVGGGLGSLSISAAATDAIVLRGLSFNGIVSQTDAVIFASGGSLLVDHCKIEGFLQGAGLYFQNTTPAELSVIDIVLSNDGAPGYQKTNPTSVLIRPSPGASVTAKFERVQILGPMGNAIRVDATYGPVDVELHDVTVDGAIGGAGIVAISQTSGGPTAKIVADNVTSSHNAGFGFRAVGATASIILSRSVSEDNGVGVGASSGGQIFSYGDNRSANNVDGDGVTPTLIGPK